MQPAKRMRGNGRPVDPVPKGWRECPSMGDVSDMHPFIPCKVPLGGKLGNEDIEPQFRFTPAMACEMAHARISAFAAMQPPGWVPPWAAQFWRGHNPFQPALAVIIDLTNSSRYYQPNEVVPGVYYTKVPCVGRDASPDPLAVNQFCWEVHKALRAYPNTYFLVHCTHGFNRTGYMIVAAMSRLLAATGMCVERGVRRFARQRPPGIYKDHYISDLFKYHHEARPAATATPPVPLWKGPDTPEGAGDDDGPDADGGAAPGGGAEESELQHDDKFGEAVPDEEREWVAAQVHDAMMGQHERLPPSAEPPSRHVRNMQQMFVGSQPVSLDREKLEFVKRKRYWVTWKADGTRYMLLLTNWGAYLMDRACEVRRVQMRFPTALTEQRGAEFAKARAKAKRPEDVGLLPVGPPHNWTLLDGEMVVDTFDEGGAKKQRRRYLAYDLMLLNGEGVMDLKFGDRHLLIEKEVAAPRAQETRWMGQLPPGRAPLVYLYGEEPFGFRRKDFYQLHRGRKLLDEFIPRLCHESDGLILQPHDDPYIPRTCDDLLKWKFAALNSVDFKLEALPGREPQLLLNVGGGGRDGGALNGHRPKEGARLLVEPGFDPARYHGRFIECSWDKEAGAWRFMRERTDKGTANHVSVFDKVVRSIEDNLQEVDLLETFEAAYREVPHLYQEDIQAQQGHPPQHRHRFVNVAPPPYAARGGGGGGGGGGGMPYGHAPAPPPHQQWGGPAPHQQQWGQQPPGGGFGGPPPPHHLAGPGGFVGGGGFPPPHGAGMHPQQQWHGNGGGGGPAYGPPGGHGQRPPRQHPQQRRPPERTPPFGGPDGGGGGGAGGAGGGGGEAYSDATPGDDAVDQEAGDYLDDDDPANAVHAAGDDDVTFTNNAADDEFAATGDAGAGSGEDGGGGYMVTEAGELPPP